MTSSGTQTPGRIVVGFDNSEASQEALRWAVDRARTVGSEVVAVRAWQRPPVFVQHKTWAEREAAERALTADLASFEVPGVTIRPVFAEGPASTILLDASDGAEILVLGTRGRGPVLGLVLGSVSTHCIHHAACPVAVFTGPRTPAVVSAGATFSATLRDSEPTPVG